MGYVLESLHESYYGKIIENAENLKFWCSVIKHCLRVHGEHRNWAMDTEANKYLIGLPLVSGPDRGLDNHFIFYNARQTYVLVQENGGNDFHFDKDSLPTESDLVNIITDIECAFMVYGKYGSGILNRRGRPAGSVNPNFRELK